MAVGDPENNTGNQYGWQVKSPVILPGVRRSTKVDMDIQGIENLLNDHSVRAEVFRTAFCPNVKGIDDATHEIDCTLCNGSGLVDRHPLCTWAYFQTQELKPYHFQEGWVVDNSVAVTFPIGVELFYYTLVKLPDYTEIFTQNVQRQAGGTDLLKYKACRINFVLGSSGQEYYEITDFTLDQNGSIRWLPSRGPAVNSIYTVHYEAAVQFRAVRALHVNRFVPITVKGGTKQVKGPEQWILQKEYLVTRVDANGTILNPNQINPLT